MISLLFRKDAQRCIFFACKCHCSSRSLRKQHLKHSHVPTFELFFLFLMKCIYLDICNWRRRNIYIFYISCYSLMCFQRMPTVVLLGKCKHCSESYKNFSLRNSLSFVLLLAFAFFIKTAIPSSIQFFISVPL